MRQGRTARLPVLLYKQRHRAGDHTPEGRADGRAKNSARDVDGAAGLDEDSDETCGEGREVEVFEKLHPWNFGRVGGWVLAHPVQVEVIPGAQLCLARVAGRGTTPPPDIKKALIPTSTSTKYDCRNRQFNL